MLLSAATPPYY